MTYAVIISGQVSTTTTRQIIITNYNGKNYFYERFTSGGRGETNAWSQTNVLSDYDYPIVGEILSTPLKPVDTQQLDSAQMPTVLIQKLTKQYRLRHNQIDSTRTMGDVVEEVLSLIEQDPSLLSKYRSDGRANKTVTTKTERKIVTPKPITTQPLIKVVHNNYQENALSFVPSLNNPELANYVERVFADGTTETQIYDYAISNNQNVSVVGGAGTGKTTSGMRYAALRGLRYYGLNFNAGVESSQMFGKLIPNEDGKLVWQDGGFTECWRNGNAVIVLDELTFMNQKQSGVLFPCLDAKRTLTLLDNKGEVIPAGDNVLVIASYNEGYKGNNVLNEAFKDRFHHKLVFDYDSKIERNFIVSNTLLELASQMRADSIAGVYDTPISTRLLKNFQEFSQAIGYNYAVDNFINNFRDDEKGSIKLLLDAHRHNLELELTGKNS